MSDRLDPRSVDTREAASRDARDVDTVDPRDVVTQGLTLSRGGKRERVDIDDRAYHLRGSEVRTLATLGAFRVVPANALTDDAGRPGDLWHGDLDRLREAGLIRGITPTGRDASQTLVALTERGHAVLEAHRTPGHQPAQRFSARGIKTRELGHDSQLYRAYLHSADRLMRQGARIHRVVLDDELKRQYQQFLQEANRDRSDADGRPTRSRDEIDEWAHAHDLPIVDDHVLFPDLRIEYEWADGRREVEDLEIVTPHYRGAHAAAKARSGFTRYRTGGGRVGGRSGRSGRGGRPFDPAFAEEVLT
jgi:DNA-binding PadR family transcriptional regulator